ncbi:hypothetical protein QJQ45_016654 [Haematococcus lacustris]|nr:hypothetical protein QJQ45_016654 [Haematococcus lacustris]
MQRLGESRWRPLELCYWPDQGALPAKGKKYPDLGYRRLRGKPPKAQQLQQPTEAHKDLLNSTYNHFCEWRLVLTRQHNHAPPGIYLISCYAGLVCDNAIGKISAHVIRDN